MHQELPRHPLEDIINAEIGNIQVELRDLTRTQTKDLPCSTKELWCRTIAQAGLLLWQSLLREISVCMGIRY